MTHLDQTNPPYHCGHTGCGNPSETVDLFNGRRCALHRPRFDGAVVVRLMRGEGHKSALAYLRTWAAVEAA